MFTEEMLLAGAKAIFEAEIGMADWNNKHWEEFKKDCFRNARLVLFAALAVSPATLGGARE